MILIMLITICTFHISVQLYIVITSEALSAQVKSVLSATIIKVK